MAGKRNRTLLAQFDDPTHDPASVPPAAAAPRRSFGKIMAALLLVLAPLGLAAFLLIGSSRDQADARLSERSDTAPFAERMAGLGASPPVQAGSAEPGLRSGPDAPGPGSGAADGIGRNEGSEASAAPRPLAEGSAGGEPSRPIVLASSDPGSGPDWSPFKPPVVVRGVSEKEIRLGIAAPFTGPSRELGRQMKLGLDTAFNLANEAGGVHGRQLKLISADDAYDPARTPEAVKQLLETHQVFGFVGNVGTPTAAVALPLALQNKALFFGPFTGANLLRAVPPDRYVFNYRPSYAEETEAVVRYLVRVRGLRPNEIAVFAQQDAYGDDGFAGVAKALRGLQGGSAGPILRLNYQRNTVDVTDAVARLRAAKPPIKAVVMVATYRAAAKFIEATRGFNPKLIYTNVSFVGSTALRDELMLLGPNYADGVIVTQVVPAVAGHSKAVLDYKAALAKHFPGETPDYVSLEGYVVGRIFVEGLKRAGPQLDTEKLVDALEGIQGLDLGLGTVINFGPSEHQGSHKVWGTQLDKAGVYNPIDLE